MRVPLILLILITALSSRAAAQDSASAVQPRLLAVLQQIDDAFARRDSVAVRRLLADGYSSVEPGGEAYSASDVVERVMNNPIDLVVHEEILEPATTLAANGDSAVLRYRSVMTVAQGGRALGTMRRRVTATFVRQGGQWLLALQRTQEDAP